MRRLLKSWIRETDAQDLIEYSMLGAFLSICAIVLLLAIGGNVSDTYNGVGAATSVAAGPSGSPGNPGNGNPGGGNGNPGGGNGNPGGGNGNPGGGNGNPGGGNGNHGGGNGNPGGGGGKK